MSKSQIHIVEVMANNSSVPYFTWFAEASKRTEGIKMSFVVLYPIRPLMLDEMKLLGCDCYWIPFDDKKRKRHMVIAFFKMLRLFLKIRPDVVHTHLFDDSLPGLAAAFASGIRSRIVTKQDTGFHWENHPFLVYLDRINNFFATKIHTVAPASHQFVIEKEKASPSKLVLIRNGFPIEKISVKSDNGIRKIKERYALEGKFVVGTVGKSVKWKGYEYILSAAEILSKRIPEIYFLWAGADESPYKDKLKNLIAEKSLGAFIGFTERLTHSEMPNFYRSLDIYLHPAIGEPFGFSIAEALMNETPVACTQTGSSSTLVHLKDAFLLKERSSEDIIESILFYYQNQPRRLEIAKNGMQNAKVNLGFDAMWKGHCDMYWSELK